MGHGVDGRHEPDQVHNPSKQFLKQLRCAQLKVSWLYFLELWDFQQAPPPPGEGGRATFPGALRSPACEAFVQHRTPRTERGLCIDGSLKTEKPRQGLEGSCTLAVSSLCRRGPVWPCERQKAEESISKPPG